MMKIYRKWDYDMIVSTVYGTAEKVGIEFTEEDRTEISSIVRGYCDTVRRYEDKSHLLSRAILGIAACDGYIKLLYYINLTLSESFERDNGISQPDDFVRTINFEFTQFVIDKRHKYIILIK